MTKQYRCTMTRAKINRLQIFEKDFGMYLPKRRNVRKKKDVIA